MFKYIPVLSILGYTTYTDLKERIVSDVAVLVLLLYSFFIVNDYRQSIIMGAFVFITHLVLAVITDGGVGGGDIKLMSVLAFMLGYDMILLAFPLAVLMIITTIYCIATGKGIKYSVPFAPYVFISYIVVLIMKYSFVFYYS